MSSTFLSMLGIIVLAIVAAQLGLHLLRFVSRLAGDRRMQRLRMQQLRLEIGKLQASIQAIAESGRAWDGWRKFRVQRKVAESRDCHSIYLVPHDGKPLPTFFPGQFLTCQFRIPDEDKPIVRCYSLSSGPDPEYFRCTVKRAGAPEDAADAPAGKVSEFINSDLREGDLLDLKAPRGSFHLDESTQRPVALLAAGIGITPLFSMLSALVSRQSTQDAHVFYSVRNSTDHIFKQPLEEIVRQHPHVRLTTCYSNALDADVQGRDYDVCERISMELLRDRLPSSNFEFYICGPAGFMDAMVSGLRRWGVASDSIHTEAFGPRAKQMSASPILVAQSGEEGVEASAANGHSRVCFERSKKECDWDGMAASLLDLAETVGVAIDSGCRSGNCGTCVTAVKSGSVDYAEAPEVAVDDGSCLPCVAVPNGPVVLDA